MKLIAPLFVVGLLLPGCTVTPVPFTNEQNRHFGAEKIRKATANQEPIVGPITLYEAIARSLKYNLDAKVEVMELTLRRRELKLAHYSMLPSVVAASGYAGRDEGDPSTSATRDPDVLSSNLNLAWNILDFGLSYVRARQAADEILVQQEMKRKIVNRVVEDVRTAFWRAECYERLIDRIRILEGELATALRESRELSGGGKTSPLIALVYERELIEVRREVEILETQLIASKNQLAALMNIDASSKFTLKAPQKTVAKLGLPSEPQALFALAVANRPEMREVAYKLRINDREMDAEMLRLLPNFNLTAGVNYDSNRFIASNDWISWGSSASWNLIRLAALPSTREKIDAQRDALETRAMSIAVAVMTQVHISRIRYRHLVKSYATASDLASVTLRILNQVRAEEKAGRATKHARIREEMNSLLADAKRDLLYADLQNAFANFYASVGMDPFPRNMNFSDDSIANIATRLEKAWVDRNADPAAEFTARN